MKYLFNKLAPVFILWIVSASFLWYMYQDVLLYPNSFLFNDSGDAIKNYFTYAAQSKSNGWIQSTLMNYPYGETIFYLDCHPLLTWMLHGLGNLFPGISEYSVGILHILMILSLFFTVVFVYLIFCELRLNRWWAAIGAFGIMLMSPQIFRMTGHLALSYAVFIPLTWYLTIRFYNSRDKFTWSLLIGMNVLFWYLIHAYLGMIALSFVALQFLSELFVFKRGGYKLVREWIQFGIQVLIPAIVFWSLVTFTDHHIGRTTNPWGFFSDNANLETIFLPHHGILRQWLDPVINFHHQNWDGWAYIGVSSTLVLTLLIIGWIQRKRKQSTGMTIVFEQVAGQQILRRALFASVLLLLFAMAIPFNLGLQFLLEWFPVIKKFRGNGRFAWVFYYAMTVTSVYVLHCIYFHDGFKKLSRPGVKIATIIFLLLYIGEGWPYHRDVAGQYGKFPNTFSSTHLPAYYEDGLGVIDPSQFQAILPLPFYHKGSENFAVESTDNIYRTSMTLAYHTQLPIWGNYSTHTSIPEAKNSLQTLSPDYYEKTIRNDITTPKDVLIVYSRDPLNRYEKAMLHKGEKLFSNDRYELYRLPVDRIFESSAQSRIDDFLHKLKNEELHKKDDIYLSDSSAFYMHEDFENLPSIYQIEGEGAYHGQLSDRKTLFTVPAGTLDKDSVYQLSFWFSNFGKNFGQDITNVKVRINEIMDNGEQKTLLEQRPASSMVINGDWSLVEMEFSPHNSAHPIEIFLRGPWKEKGEYYIDELLLREKGLDVYKVLQRDGDVINGLMKNNQRIWVEQGH